MIHPTASDQSAPLGITLDAARLVRRAVARDYPDDADRLLDMLLGHDEPPPDTYRRGSRERARARAKAAHHGRRNGQ